MTGQKEATAAWRGIENEWTEEDGGGENGGSRESETDNGDDCRLGGPVFFTWDASRWEA